MNTQGTKAQVQGRNALNGWWEGQLDWLSHSEESFINALNTVTRPVYCVEIKDSPAFTAMGTALLGLHDRPPGSQKLLAYAPPCPPQCLGNPAFCKDYGLTYPYLAGSMAHGISSVPLVQALAEEGMLAFYGAAGQPCTVIEQVIDELSVQPGLSRCGFNLIHSPNEPGQEEKIVEVYLRKGVLLIEASAYVDLTLPLVRYRLAGIRHNPDGSIETPHRVIAKISRTEVASKFLSPPPETILQELAERGELTQEQRNMARSVPVATDLTAEADSGGHTDNRPAITLLPTTMALRDQMQRKYNFTRPTRTGLGGGISTPLSAAAAFIMGADYIVTGSINQACLESGTSDMVRGMLAAAQQADTIMAPAADMFEMGVRIQVLKTGTMFPMRAARLFTLYQGSESIEALPPAERTALEKNFFRAPLEQVWDETCAYFEEKDRSQVERALKDPRHKMALIFRNYLGQASRWAIAGNSSRKIDFQIWCGPAMGAFNEWARGSHLEKPGERRAVTVALNLLHGAAVIMRLNSLRQQGFRQFSHFSPLPLEEAQIRTFMG